MYDNSTPAKEIKRLLPGQYILVSDGKINVHQYYEIPWNKFDLSNWSEKQIIEEINKRFVSAVKLEYDKDCEYGYTHLADMSGGLDCRMAAWVAKQNGYDNIVNIHYSQSGSNEINITTQIVKALKNELCYYPLDMHKFLYDAEQIISMNYGLQLYTGITGGERVLRNLNLSEYGLEHTGMIGDIVLGSHFNGAIDRNKVDFEGLYSLKNKDMLNKEHLKPYEGNPEKQFIMIRGLMGALSSAFIRRHYIEITSPFMDVDFMEFCFSIPSENRANHELYKKWIIAYYPEAAKIRWSTDDTLLTDGKLMQYLRRAYYHLPRKFARIAGLKWGQNSGMNPFEYWFQSDKNLLPYWNRLISLPVSACSDYLADRINRLFLKGNALEKTQAVSAALAIKYWMRK